MTEREGSENVRPTSLQGIAKKAQSQKRYRFRNLSGMLNEELLRESWREIKKHAAAGVDQIRAQDYEPQLEENIRDLGERLKQKRYRAKLVCRHYLPKGKVVATDEKGHCNGLSWNAEASRTEEPGAGKSHAGICAGAAG